MPQEFSSSSNVAVSLALFVATTVVSLSLCHERESRHRRGRRREGLDYSSRRTQSRLSPSHHDRKSIFSQHVAPHHADPHEEIFFSLDDAGFRPKNRNWKHFESNNVDDVEEGIVSPPVSASSFQDSSSDDGSSSSLSDEFLWTQQEGIKHHHHHHRHSDAVARTCDKSHHQNETDVRNTKMEGEAEEIETTWTKIRRKMVLNTVGRQEEDLLSDKSNESFISADSSLNPPSSLDEMLPPTRPKIQRPETYPENPGRPGLEQKNNSMWDLLSKSIPDMVHLERYTTAPQEQKPEVAAYNASILPSKVVLIRHGQSEGNINESLYATTPDNAMRLTKLGWDQAHMAGQALKEKILTSGESIHFIVSPYVRTVETFHGIVSAWCDPSEFNHIEDRGERIKAWYGRLLEMGLTWHEDPRIREQDFGNYQDPVTIKKCKAERHKFGLFYYRFPHGESASDVFDRVSTFLDSLWRSFDLQKSRNYVLITHGISIRVFLARYFRYGIGQFSMLANPKNCEMVVLGHDGKGKLKLRGRCEMELNQNANSDEMQVTGYKFHKRLRVLPKSAIRKGSIRVSCDDTSEND